MQSRSSSRIALSVATLFGSVGIICFLWMFNYNRIGSFFDYGIAADGAGQLARGLRPYRDFTTSIQSMTYWASYACERIFGPRYLSLAYGNLVLSFLLFAVVVYYARKRFSFPAAALFGLAAAIGSTLQHGAIWHNTMGVVLLTWITLECASMLGARKCAALNLALVFLLLVLLGTVKLNFFGAGMLIAACFGVAGISTDPGFSDWRSANWKSRTGTKIAATVTLGLVACCLPPVVEIIANHVSLSDWVNQVILTPAGRLTDLKHLVNPLFYLGVAKAYFPGTVFYGSVLLFTVAYADVGYMAWRSGQEKSGDRQSGREESNYALKNRKARWIRLGLLAVLWLAACATTATNVDMLSLGLCLLMTGIVALGISGQFEGLEWTKLFSGIAVAFAVYIALASSVTLVRHSRLLFEPGVFVSEPVPADGMNAYFAGVLLTEKSAERLAAIDDILRQNPGVPIYWGPGLGIMNRLRPGVMNRTLPLWYHKDVSVRDSFAPRLISGIEHTGAGMIIGDSVWVRFFTPEVLRYLDQSWARQEAHGIVVWKKRSQ
jgi:hypothetical protein